MAVPGTKSRSSGFPAVMVLAFLASTVATISGWRSMSSMPGMEMPGGWTMSMMWMRMPGQSWPVAAAMFLGMWSVMMIAMMLPALAPALARYRRAANPEARSQLGMLTTIVALAYFVVWTLAGLAAFPLGMALAQLAMDVPALSRAVPLVSAITVVMAGALQFTSWKSRELHCCRGDCASSTATTRAAWRHGLRLGAHCIRCCAGLMAILLVVGIMDLGAMVIVTLAITTERVAPAGQLVARLIGALAIAAGLILLAQT
jgi:predicted metal-binding membrane protein